MRKQFHHKTGEIILFNNHGNMLMRRRYCTSWDRNRIIEGWKKFYKDRFNSFYYHIMPELKDDEVLTIEQVRTRVRRKYA